MRKLAPSETLIVGHWLSDGRGGVVADDSARRIEELVRAFLVELGTDSSGWEVLYRDPDDGRLWELTYPQGELQGGGPPQLRQLSREEAQQKYQNIGKD
jgi:hypothetical protein